MIADLLGELQGSVKLGETLLASAEVGEAAAAHGQRSDLCLACTDGASKRERLLARSATTLDGARPASSLRRVTPARRRARARAARLVRSRPRARARRSQHCRCRSRTGTRRGRHGGSPLGAGRRADELDRSRASSTARAEAPTGWRVGCPGAHRGEVEPGEPGRVGYRGPERDRALEMRMRFRQAENRLRLACRLDRRDQRLGAATRCRPMRRELGRSRNSAARELAGQPRMQLLALAGQDGRVDRLGEQGVPEAEGAVAGSATRTACSTARRSDSRTSGSGSSRQHRAADSRRRVRRPQPPQEALRRTVEPRHALQQQVAQAVWKLHARIASGGEQLLGEEGVALGAGDDRVGQRRRQRSVR